MQKNSLFDFIDKMAPAQEGAEVTPYFEPYEVDKFARDRMLEPIEFDWSRVSELDPIEEDTEWYDTPFYKMCVKKGLNHRRFLVSCPTHGYFKQTIMTPPAPKIGYKCQRCITAEIDRIVNKRSIRDYEYKRRMKEERS